MQSETGDWEVYNVNTGETLETLHGYPTRGAAADSVYDKYAGQGIGFNLRPADPEQPEKPLSSREKLAKNIKQAPAEEIKNWRVYDTKTGEVHYEQEGRKSNLVQAMRKMEIDQKMPRGRLAIEEIPGKDADKDEPLRTWEIVDRMDNNKVLDTVGGTEAEAERVRQTWVRQAGRGEDSNIGKRSVPTDASRERYNDRQELNPVTDQPPTGFQTQRPATGDYYEVKSGDRIYGYLSTQAATDNNRSAAIEVKRYIEQLTGRDDAQLVYRAGDPVQARASNGVPMWEVYERETGHVVHTFADHDQTSAWATGQAWVRGVGAEDPGLFSVRPKMSA
jgi:hypothetical protein